MWTRNKSARNLSATENFGKQIASANLKTFILTKVNAKKSVLWSHYLFLIQKVIFTLASSDSQTEDWIGVAGGIASGITDVNSPGSWKAAVAVEQWLEPLQFSVRLYECVPGSVWGCELSNQDYKQVFLILQSHKSLRRYHTQKPELWLFSIWNQNIGLWSKPGAVYCLYLSIINKAKHWRII